MKQTTIETIEVSTFESKFIALKTTVELREALCYKLRMLGILLAVLASIYYDNDLNYSNNFSPRSVKRSFEIPKLYHIPLAQE